MENLVKTWEMERSHKSDPTQHKTVDQERFSIGANGGKMFNNLEANKVGNYNLLLDTADKALYDAEATSWEDSHEKFGDAFAAFPCAPRTRGILARAFRAPHSCLRALGRVRRTGELLEVFSGPPTVAFGKAELVELFGFGMATVNENLQLCECHFYYDANSFLEVLQGTKSADRRGDSPARRLSSARSRPPSAALCRPFGARSWTSSAELSRPRARPSRRSRRDL